MTKQTITRLTLYVAIAMLTVLMNDFGKLDPEVARNMYWTEWVLTALSPIVAGLVAAKAFLDQSISKTLPKS